MIGARSLDFILVIVLGLSVLSPSFAEEAGRDLSEEARLQSILRERVKASISRGNYRNVTVLCPEGEFKQDPTESLEPRVERPKTLERSRYLGTPLPPEFAELGAKCEIFITKNGEYGPSGKTIEWAIAEEPSLFPDLISDEAAQLPSMKAVCPGYASMQRSDRVHMMVWTIASIAWDETKCGETLHNPENLHARGILQMNRDESDREWRGEFCLGEGSDTMDPVASATDPHGTNILCGLEVLQGQFQGAYGSRDVSREKRKGLYPYAYWEKLQGKYAGDMESPILRRMRLHPGCQSGAGNKKAPRPRPSGLGSK